MQIDGPELYPPDSKDNSPEARATRNRSVAGVFLVAWGSGLLASRVLHIHNLDYTGLAIGLAVLAGWNQLRRYVWFVIGAVLTGAGLGGLISSLIGGGAVGSAVGAFGVAAGFAACYVRYPTRSTWALIPAAIFGVIGVGSLGLGIAGLIGAHLAGFLMPGLLISAGLLLVARGSIPRKTRRIALVCTAGAFLLLASSSGFDRNHNPVISRTFATFGPAANTRHTIETLPLPSLEGKTLVIAGGAGDIEVHNGTVASATIDRTVHDRSRGLVTEQLARTFTVVESETTVELHQDRSSGVGASESDRYNLIVPVGTDLMVNNGSGTIDASVQGGHVKLHAGSGAIRLTGSPIDVELDTGSGDVNLLQTGGEGAGAVRLKTGSGDITAQVAGHPQVDVQTGSGNISIDGAGRDGHAAHADGSPGAVTVTTGSGDVEVRRLRSSSPTTTTAKG